MAGDGKKSEILGGPAEGVLRRGVGESAQILDAPTKILNTHRTDTPHHNTTQHNNNDTPHNTREDPAQGGLGQGWSRAGRSMAQKNKT